LLNNQDETNNFKGRENEGPGNILKNLAAVAVAGA
jgi:hypothetical protein